MQNILIVYGVGTIASFFGIIAGGAGLITIPLLLLFGLPPQIAIATNRLGSFGLITGGLMRYLGKGHIVWKYAIPFSILQIIGGAIGASLLVEINEDLIKNIIAIMILIILPLMHIKKDLGVKEKSTSKPRDILGFIIYFANTIYTGFLGAGAGTIAMLTKLGIFRMTFTQAIATGLIPFSLGIISALVVFIWHGLVDWPLGISLLVGMTTGSYIGAHLTITKGTAWAKTVFTIFVSGIAIKLLFF